MNVTAPTPIHTTREPHWTPRQKEVLDLLVKGHTNGQIAERLGISLDGAKWHVSEIITRLGVDSRDEAAEYWRHHNGLRMRFTRIASGFFTSGALKWSMGTAFVAGIVVVSAMVIVALRESGGDEPEQGGGIQNPDTSTPDPTTPATPTPTPSVTPPPAATPPPTGEVIAGVSVSRITFTAPGGLPVDGLSVVVEKGCYQCDSPAEAFERVTSEGGQQRVETLFDPANGYISASYFDSAGGAYYVSVCTRGYCGGVGQISDDAQTTIYRSTDGGVTWTDAGTFDRHAAVVAVTSNGPLLNRSEFVNGATDYRFQLLGSSTVVRPPAGFEPAYTAAGDVIGWQKAGSRDVVDFEGNPMVVLPDVGARSRIEARLGTSDFLISWLSGPSATEQYRYLGVMRGGTLTAIYRGDPTLTVGNWANQNLVWGNIWASPTDVNPASSDNRGKLHPMYLDLHSGQVQLLELYGPAFSDAYDAQRNRIREYTPGPFLRVTGAGDCLNIRQQPSTSADVVGCFADNVLLVNLAEEQQAGGIAWKKVRTPGGQQGWASAEFLRGTLSNP